MTLKPLSLIFKRLRSKAFSPVCLSRFLYFLPLIPNTTQSLAGGNEGELFKTFVHPRLDPPLVEGGG
jgi:hypothetical protein